MSDFYYPEAIKLRLATLMKANRLKEARMIRNFMKYLNDTPVNMDSETKFLKPIAVETEDQLVESIYMYCLCMRRSNTKRVVESLQTNRKNKDDLDVFVIGHDFTREHIRKCLRAEGKLLLEADYFFEAFEDSVSRKTDRDQWEKIMRSASKLAVTYLLYSDALFGADRSTIDEVEFCAYIITQRISVIFNEIDDERQQFAAFISLLYYCGEGAHDEGFKNTKTRQPNLQSYIRQFSNGRCEGMLTLEACRPTVILLEIEMYNLLREKLIPIINITRTPLSKVPQLLDPMRMITIHIGLL